MFKKKTKGGTCNKIRKSVMKETLEDLKKIREALEANKVKQVA